MKLSSLCVIATTLVLGVGCAPTFQYVPTTDIEAASKGNGCQFSVLTTLPHRPYQELGILQPNSTYRAEDVQVFKSQVSDAVCRAGGDAVIAEINGMGQYVRGTVISYD